MREPAKASATSAGTCAFIAQVRSSAPDEPNLRPAMNTTFGKLRQRFDLRPVEEIGLDALDAPARQLAREVPSR